MDVVGSMLDFVLDERLYRVGAKIAFYCYYFFLLHFDILFNFFLTKLSQIPSFLILFSIVVANTLFCKFLEFVFLLRQTFSLLSRSI